MLSLLAAIVFAQSSVTLQIGKDKQDSVARTKSDPKKAIRTNLYVEARF